MNDQQLRVFFSFHIPTAIGGSLLRLFPKSAAIALYPEENLHMTLKFIGNIPQERYEKLIEIAEDAAYASSSFVCAPTQFYVAEDRLRLGVALDPILMNLQKDLSQRLEYENLGKREIRSFIPHITMGRPNQGFNISMFQKVPLSSHTLPLSEFGLYKSEQGDNKTGHYTLLHSFMLI